MQSLEQQLQICEKSIESVEEERKTAADQFDKATSDRDKDRFWEEEKLLREEVASLRGD